MSSRFIAAALAGVAIGAVPAALHATPYIWDGGGADNNWTNNANWVNNAGPPNLQTDDAILEGTLRPTPFVDFIWEINSLQFSGGGGAGAVTFQENGAPLIVRGGGIVNNDTEEQTIDNVALGLHQTWNAVAGPIRVNNLSLGSALAMTLTVGGPFDTRVIGPITGSDLGNRGTILLNSSANFTMGSAPDDVRHNTFAGPVIVNSGTLLLAKRDNITAIPLELFVGDGAGSDVAKLLHHNQIADSAFVTVSSAGLLDLNGQTEKLNVLTVNGGRVSVGNGALHANSAGLDGGSIAIGNGVATFDGLSFIGGAIDGSGTIEVRNNIVAFPSAQTSRIAGSFVNFVQVPLLDVRDGLSTDDFEIVNLRAGEVTKGGAGQLVLDSANTAGSAHANGGTVVFRNSAHLDHLFVANGATARFETSGHLTSGLHVNAGKVVLGSGGGDKVLITQSLDLINNALIDVGEHAVIVDYTDSSSLASIRSAIISGRNGGGWNGFGIRSSLADASSFGVGYAESADLFAAFPATFVGEQVDARAVLLRFTLYGDANLDATVNIADFSRLAANFNLPGPWSRGDFNYDGTVGIGDFALLAGQFNQTLSSAALASAGAVPEPAACGVAVLGCACLLVRLRRCAAGRPGSPVQASGMTRGSRPARARRTYASWLRTPRVTSGMF